MPIYVGCIYCLHDTVMPGLGTKMSAFSWIMHSLIQSQQISIRRIHDWKIHANDSYMKIQVWNPLPGVNGNVGGCGHNVSINMYWTPRPALGAHTNGVKSPIYAVVVHRASRKQQLLLQC